jgi:uncharacterized protein (DUF488 family)
MAEFNLSSIGHFNIPAERFVKMLRGAGVDAVADVRSTPYSRFFPWFSGKKLAGLLAREAMAYLPYGDALGGRPRDPALYRDGIADYEAMARQPEFQAGLERLRADASRCRVCLLCAEREPLDCHRCLLVGRALAARGLAVGHILHNGTIEPQGVTEKRLLQIDGQPNDLFVTGDLFITGQHERLAAAYRRRAHAVAYRVKAKANERRPGAGSSAEKR